MNDMRSSILLCLVLAGCGGTPLNNDWRIDSAFSEDERYKIEFAIDWWNTVTDRIHWGSWVMPDPHGSFSVRRVPGIYEEYPAARTNLTCEVRIYPGMVQSTLMIRNAMIHEAAHCALQTRGHEPKTVLDRWLPNVRRCLSPTHARLLCERYECGTAEINHLCEPDGAVSSE